MGPNRRDLQQPRGLGRGTLADAAVEVEHLLGVLEEVDAGEIAQHLAVFGWLQQRSSARPTFRGRADRQESEHAVGAHEAESPRVDQQPLVLGGHHTSDERFESPLVQGLGHGDHVAHVSRDPLSHAVSTACKLTPQKAIEAGRAAVRHVAACEPVGESDRVLDRSA